ncbi:MAG: hypothetical protein JO157_09950 [Acetobacteraceae bacterium]|nr:hypothetical protein [Acetobacteraceae bacterium]
MSTFDAFGEAALLAHAGQRQIAATLAAEVPHLARSLLVWLRRSVASARVG